MGKYPLVIRSRQTAILLLFLSFLFHPDLSAQTYRFNFRNIPLSDALVQISGQLDIKVAFDSKKLGSVTISREVNGNTPDEVVSKLLRETGFEYRIKYGRYLIFKSDPPSNSLESNDYQIIGSVSDRNSGEKLPYATIVLPEENLLIPASENGTFCIRDLRANPVHLRISHIGYNPVDTVILLSGRETSISMRLNDHIHLLDSIEVKSSRMEMVDLRNDVDFATTINLGKRTDLPVLAETDVFRMLQVIPGISYPENSVGLSIRGGSSDQNLVLFDGQTLYNLSHYYGLVSALNPNVIKDLQVYKGGYDSRFGERVSGIVDITGKSGNQSKTTVYGDINLLSGNLTAEVPLGKKVSFIGAMRRSYSDLYSTGFSKGLYNRNVNQFLGDSGMIINQTKPKFYFYDYNSKLTFRPNDFESFSLSFYGGKDFFRNTYSGMSDLLRVSTTDRNIWSNYGIGASWLKQWNQAFFTNIQAGSSGYENLSSNETVVDKTLSPDFDPHFLPRRVNPFNTNGENRLNDFYVSARSTYSVTENNLLNFGLLARENKIYYHKDADKVYVYDNMNQSGFTLSAYLQDRMTLSKKLTLKPGLRLSYFGNTGKLYPEPRFSANYTFSDVFSARIAAGRYYQFINQVLAQQETGYNRNFWVLADGKEHPEVASNHYILGATFEKGKILVDAEAYYKTFSGIQEYVFVSQFLKNSDFPKYFNGEENNHSQVSGTQPSSYVTGFRRTYGFDLMLRYRGRSYESWLSFSLGRSIQSFNLINNGNDIPSPADIPFQLTWTNMLSAGKWNFGNINIFSAGRPYIEYAQPGTTLAGTRIYRRLPEYFRSDFSANYTVTLRKVTFKPGISLINIFNNHNYFDINTRRFDFGNSSFSEATLIQSQPFSVNMFLHFVF